MMGTRSAWKKTMATRVALLAGVAATIMATTGGPSELDAQAVDRDARERVTHAADLMAAPGRLQDIRTVRLEMMTQWQRTGFRSVPWSDRPSFERHVDVRDYTLPAWRNTREFGSRRIVNVVRDSVATTDLGAGPQPLSVAYVDERNELFSYTPDRLVVQLLEADDLRSVGDTVIGGEPHNRVAATLGGRIDATVDFHAGTGLPTVVRFRRGHPNDFGLVPFGEMWVEVWYSNWRSFGPISIPTQWDVTRVGVPYKRMTVLDATFNPEFAADSFTVTPDLRRAYVDARRPMHDRAVDSVVAVVPGVVALHGFGFPTGAIAVDDSWILMEAGHAPLNLDRGMEELTTAGVTDLSAAVVVTASAGNGGVAALVDRSIPIYTSRAAKPFLDVMLTNANRPVQGVTVVDRGRWIGEEGAGLRLEPIDLPDVPGSLVVYSPRHRWLYAPDAMTALDRRLVLDHARARGWTVERFGMSRRLWMPLPSDSLGP